MTAEHNFLPISGQFKIFLFFSNITHSGWRVVLLVTILKWGGGGGIKTITAMFSFILQNYHVRYWPSDEEKLHDHLGQVR